MSESNISVIFIDLDSLLDIRQAIIGSIVNDNKVLQEIVTSDQYNFRKSDTFNIDMEIYREKYNNRSKIDIENSTISYMYNILKNRTKRAIRMGQIQVNRADVAILLNIYPYELTEKEAQQIAYLLYTKLDLNVEVTAVNIPYKDINMAYIKSNNIKELFIYDFNTWVKEQGEALYNYKAYDVVLNVPALINKEMTLQDENKIKENGFTDIFSLTEFLLSPIIRVVFVPVLFYTNIIVSSVKVTEFLKTNPSIADDLAQQGETIKE